MAQPNARQKRSWQGGYIIRDSKGQDLYFIRKQIDGKRYDLSTGCHNVRAAVKQLERFEANPAGYSPRGDEPEAPIYLDEALCSEFMAFSRDVKKNSPGWLRKQADYVAWWAGQLDGLDLRRVSIGDHLKPALAKAAAVPHRTATIKAIFSWLRKEKHLITAVEDPTYGALPVPQSKPEQWKRVKAIPKDHYLLAREHLPPNWRDPLDVQAATGWHLTEVQRFAQSGTIEPVPRGSAESVAGVLVCPQTKGGAMLRTAVSAEALEAAKRLHERGSLSIEKYGLAVNAACRAAQIEPFTPGQFRHSVATWAINSGADPASVAAFLNHKSPRTTRKFYATHATPKKVPTLL
jgi:integrase